MANKLMFLIRKRGILLLALSVISALLAAKGGGGGGIHTFGLWDGPS